MDLGIYEILKNNNNFIVNDKLNETTHKFNTIEECAEFIKKELIYCNDY